MACSSTNNPPPDAFIAPEVGGGGSPCTTLPSPDSTFLPVGTSTGGKPTTVADQGSTGGGTASVTCTVHPQGNGFDIELSVGVAGTPGGNISISSAQGAGAVTTAGASGISASFYSNNQGYSASDCKITYTYQGQPVPDNPPISAGRIWGHIQCPHAVAGGGQMTTGPDGGPTDVACPASADFLFEQCNQ